MKPSWFVGALAALVVLFVAVAAVRSGGSASLASGPSGAGGGFDSGPIVAGEVEESTDDDTDDEPLTPILDLPPVVVTGTSARLMVSGVESGASVEWTIGNVEAEGNPVVFPFDTAGSVDVGVDVSLDVRSGSGRHVIEVVDPLSIEIRGASNGTGEGGRSFPVGTPMRLTLGTSGGVSPLTVTWTLPDGSIVEGPEATFDLASVGANSVSVSASPSGEALAALEGLSASQVIEIIGVPRSSSGPAPGNGSDPGDDSDDPPDDSKDEDPVVIDPPPTVSLTGAAAIAAGRSQTTVSAEISNAEGSPSWTVSGGCELSESGSSATVTSPEEIVMPTSCTVEIIVQGPGGSAMAVHTITILPVPPPLPPPPTVSLSGDTLVPAGIPAMVEAEISGATGSPMWTVSGPCSISGSGTTIEVTTPFDITEDVNCTVTATVEGLGGQASDMHTILVFEVISPPPSPPGG